MDTAMLEELGLSNAEARIYLALLELGPSKTGKIIDKSGLQSSTVYHILGSLIEKGLVTYILKGKIKYFQAEDPEKMLNLLEDKKKRFEQVLPELKQKAELAGHKLGAEIYEGIKGLRAAFDDILETLEQGDEYYFFASPVENVGSKEWTTFFANFHLRRAEKGITVKGLSTPQSRETLDKLYKGIKNTELRYITDFAPTGVVVYANKLITWEWKDRATAVVIESESIANSYKKFFEKMWEKAKE